MCTGKIRLQETTRFPQKITGMIANSVNEIKPARIMFTQGADIFALCISCICINTG